MSQTPEPRRFVIEVHRSKHNHAYQLSVSTLDGKGTGTGYRLHGPKFCACHGSELVVRHDVTERDVAELRRFLDGVAAATADNQPSVNNKQRT